jgi:hypothetical protein
MKKISAPDIQEELINWEKKFKDILELTNAARNGPLSSPLSADVSENYQLFPH